MKKQDKLVISACLDEIKAVIQIAKKPLIRKTYLVARRWYLLQKDTLKSVKYKGKIERLPKHKVKKEELGL